jgi:hypothetical protein
MFVLGFFPRSGTACLEGRNDAHANGGSRWRHSWVGALKRRIELPSCAGISMSSVNKSAGKYHEKKE